MSKKLVEIRRWCISATRQYKDATECRSIVADIHDTIREVRNGMGEHSAGMEMSYGSLHVMLDDKIEHDEAWKGMVQCDAGARVEHISKCNVVFIKGNLVVAFICDTNPDGRDEYGMLQESGDIWCIQVEYEVQEVKP